MFLLLAAAMLMQPPPPVWFTVAREGDTITLTAPATMRYGSESGPCADTTYTVCQKDQIVPAGWNDPMAITLNGGVSVVNFTASNGGILGGDPTPGLVKSVQVQELTIAQTVTVNGQSVTVPALPVAPPPEIVPAQTVEQDGTLTITIPPSYGLPMGTCRVGSAGRLWFLVCNGPIPSNGVDTNTPGNDATH